jgi:D-serine deaminase-like pyridoxal phosphate-dependent protein
VQAPDALDTPAAVVDLDRLERNLSRWQEFCDRVGLANRPHIKTHKSVEIARRQLALGAVGVTCQKLGEAETMAAAGIDDILVSFNILGGAKLERLAALLDRATVTVTADDEALLNGLDGAAARAGRELAVLVDCDTGLGRTGVQTPEHAVELARAVTRRSSLRFGGFFTYPAPPAARDFLEQAVAAAAKAGLDSAVVSVGGTPGMWDAEGSRPVATEWRAGTYAFHDRATVAAGAAALDDVALTVRATVVSRPTADRALLDAGSKALSYDPGPDDCHGLVLEAPHSRIERLNEEHAYVRLAPGESLELGQQVTVVPNHACVVSNLFDEFLLVRDGTPAGSTRVDARGRSR